MYGGPSYIDGSRKCPGAKSRVVLNRFGLKCLLGSQEQLLVRKLDTEQTVGQGQYGSHQCIGGSEGSGLNEILRE